MKNILITGGAGFIGSHVTNLFTEKYPEYNIVVFDALTYASDSSNINIVDNMTLVKGDIRNEKEIGDVFAEYDITDVIHLAAESHVDNSIENPNIFAETNVIGTLNLLRVAHDYWKEHKVLNKCRFHHVSTDEVYGTLGFYDDSFTEETPYDPRSPYSASKAGSDHFVQAYNETFKMNTVITNCSNNYGPHQHEEKLIPKAINCILDEKKIPVYGAGANMRDWLWVGDHAKAIDKVFHNGTSGEKYNVGGFEYSEMSNISLLYQLFEAFEELYPEDYKASEMRETCFEFVEDRKGHDLRYSINQDKIMTELGWKPEIELSEGLKRTISWYVSKQLKKYKK